VACLARSTFYYQCHALQSAEQESDIEVKIRAVYDEHKGRYGYRRITAALRRTSADPVNHKCVQRSMKKWDCGLWLELKDAPGMSQV